MQLLNNLSTYFQNLILAYWLKQNFSILTKAKFNFSILTKAAISETQKGQTFPRIKLTNWFLGYEKF